MYSLCLYFSVSGRFSENPDPAIPSTSTRDPYESSNLLKARERVTGSAFFKQLFNLSCIRLPTNVSSSVVGVLVTIYCKLHFLRGKRFQFQAIVLYLFLVGLLAIALSLTIFYAKDAIFYDMELWAWILFGVLLGLTLLVLLLISIQPRERADAPFRVPLVPLLPGISIFVNIYLMLMLDVYTWIRFGIWMGIGKPFMPAFRYYNTFIHSPAIYSSIEVVVELVAVVDQFS